MLVEIRQNIFRLCGQSIGPGGGQLCFAPEAPENAQSGQTGIVSRKDVYVAVAHEKGALRVCAEVSHQRVDASRVGFGGNTGAAAPHQRKAVRAEVVLDDLSTKSVRFVGKNGGLDALGLQRGQQFQDAGIGGRFVFLVGVIPGRKLGQRGSKLFGRPGVFRGKALHQLRDAVAHEVLVGLY